MILHSVSPHDAHLFEKILEELKHRRVIRIGDTMVCDKGYYSYHNYVHGILRFNVISLIFSKKTFSVKKLLCKLIYSLSIFGRSNTTEQIRRYQELARNLLFWLREQDRFQEIRSNIEDVFKIAKVAPAKAVQLPQIFDLRQNAFSLKRIHCYITRSVKKAVSLHALLTGLVISLGLWEKGQPQSLAEL